MHRENFKVLVGVLAIIVAYILSAFVLPFDTHVQIWESGVMALFAWGLAMTITYFTRRKSLPPEVWGLRLRRLSRDRVFWLSLIAALLALQVGRIKQ